MVAEKQLCEGISHMERKFQEIIDGGGEGVILRDPASPMRPGRSAGFLKHKVRNKYLSIISTLTKRYLQICNRNTETQRPRL